MRAALAIAFAMLAGPAISDPLVCPAPGIVDGDTLRCGSERVRLWGIQAPERHHPIGPAATRALAVIVGGRTAICERKGLDRYQRTVALCRVAGRDIAAEMVRRGHAVDWPRYSGGFYGSGAP